MAEPFLGGGSFPIEITKRYPDIRIWVNDLYPHSTTSGLNYRAVAQICLNVF